MSGTLIWIGLLTVVCVGLVLGLTPAALAFVRAMRRRSLERNAVEATADARVVDKRSRILGTVRNAPDQRYYATFEFPDGNRLELEVTGPEFGMLVIGDQGTLDWKGPRYLGFARAIMR